MKQNERSGKNIYCNGHKNKLGNAASEFVAEMTERLKKKKRRDEN